MKTFSASHLVNAKPMDRREYNDLRGWDVPENENGTDYGFLVENPKGASNHGGFKGYVTWLPELEFQADHLLVPTAQGKPLHEQRMLAEQIELHKKLDALKVFTKDARFLALPFIDRDLLQAQCRIMSMYIDVLDARIARFKPQ